MNDTLEYEPEADGTFEFESVEEWESSWDTEDMEGESPFDEVDEMELAADLLEVSDEAEFDQFLGKLFKKVKGGLGKFAKSGIGRKLGGFLKGAAKVALPIAGKALGGFVGGPAGAMLGGQLASTAGKMFGLELEGLSDEDQSFEVARKFVRFAGTAAKKAASVPQTADPTSAARAAVVAAARKHAPGLIRKSGMTRPTTTAGGSGGRSGRWVRRGRKIIIINC